MKTKTPKPNYRYRDHNTEKPDFNGVIIYRRSSRETKEACRSAQNPGNRVVWNPPQNPFIPEALKLPPEKWKKLRQGYFDLLNNSPRTGINHEAAGSHTVFPSLCPLRISDRMLVSGKYV